MAWKETLLVIPYSTRGLTQFSATEMLRSTSLTHTLNPLGAYVVPVPYYDPDFHRKHFT